MDRFIELANLQIPKNVNLSKSINRKKVFEPSIANYEKNIGCPPLLVWQICSLNWDLEMDSFGVSVYQLWWFSGKILAQDARGSEFKYIVSIHTFSYFLLGLCSSWQNTMNVFENIYFKFGNEFWLILYQEPEVGSAIFWGVRFR
jgi:hypothetical protein